MDFYNMLSTFFPKGESVSISTDGIGLLWALSEIALYNS